MGMIHGTHKLYLLEVLNHLIVSKELEFISEEVYLKLREHIYKISNMLNALRKSQLKNV